MADHSKSRDLRPDLDENINVAEAHAALKAAPAVGREKSLRENGMESVSLWLLLVSGVVLLVAGAVFGQGGGFLNYGELVKDGYIQGNSPVGEEEPLLPQPALSFLQKQGAKHYSTCNGCHGPGGAGQPGNNIPPLAGSEWVNGNTEKLLLIVHNGVTGPISVAGATYNSQMGAIGANLGPKEMASLLTYIRTSWGNTGDIVTPEMAANGLAISKKRGGGKTTAEELKKSHDKMLSGAKLAPDTLLDPETWEPVTKADDSQDAAEGAAN